jgi:hypothetical protein
MSENMIIVRVKIAFTITDGEETLGYMGEEFVRIDANQSGLEAKVESIAYDKIVSGLWMKEGMKITSYKTTLMVQVGG